VTSEGGSEPCPQLVAVPAVFLAFAEKCGIMGGHAPRVKQRAKAPQLFRGIPFRTNVLWTEKFAGSDAGLSRSSAPAVKYLATPQTGLAGTQKPYHRGHKEHEGDYGFPFVSFVVKFLPNAQGPPFRKVLRRDRLIVSHETTDTL